MFNHKTMISEYLQSVHGEVTLRELLDIISPHMNRHNVTPESISIYQQDDGDGPYIELFVYKLKTPEQLEKDRINEENYQKSLINSEKNQLKQLIQKYKEDLPEILSDKKNI